jgi:hypothetical protein
MPEQGKTALVLHVDDETIELIEHMKRDFGLATNEEVLETLIMFSREHIKRHRIERS